MRRTTGFTLLELLVVILILGILLSIVGINLTKLRNPAREGQALTSATLKTIRARAIATTSAYRMTLSTDKLSLQADTATDCSSTTWTRKALYDMTLPDKAAFQNTAWIVCFNSRGTISTLPALPLTVTDSNNHQYGLQAYLGGAIGATP